MARIIIFLIITLIIIASVYLLSKFGRKLLTQRQANKEKQLEFEKTKLAFDRCKDLLLLLTYDEDLAFFVKEDLILYFKNKDTKLLEKKRIEMLLYSEEQSTAENKLQNQNLIRR